MPTTSLLPRVGSILAALALVLSLPSTHAQALTPACEPEALIQAIQQANGNGAADTITLPAGCVYRFTTPYNTTNDDGTLAANTLPSIANDVPGLDLRIVGGGATLLRAPGATPFRLLRVDNGAELSIADLTLEGGSAPQGGAIYVKWRAAGLTVDRATFRNNQATASNAEYGGGAILVHESTLTVRDSVFTGNHAAALATNSNSAGGAIRNLLSDLAISGSSFSDNSAAFGGAVYIDGGLRDGAGKLLGTPFPVIASSFAGNSAHRDGGAIYRCLYGATQPLQLVASTLQGNQAGGQGGGLVANCTGQLSIERSTVAGNRAGAGGGGLVVDKVAANITNSTIAENSVSDESGYGGGIWVYEGQVVLSHATMAANSAGFGGGIAMSSGSSGRLHNSIMANKATNPYQTRWNCMGPQLQNDGGNIEHPGTANNQFDRDCAPQIMRHNPLLLPLTENGGPTRTMALGAGSGARGAGIATSCAASDQRGLRREGSCDSGAYNVETVPTELQYTIYLPAIRR